MLFISPSKLFSFSRYLNFCLDFMVKQKNGLLRKIRLISKITTPKRGKQTIAIHILFNISRCKEKQGMKFGQLVAYNIKNIFLEKSYTKYSGEAIPRPFLKS